MIDVPLLVLGSGHAGLLTALALAHQGFPVHLLERGLDPASGGSSPEAVVLPPMANRELGALGLLDGLTARAEEPRFLHHADAVSGRPVRRVPMGSAIRDRWSHPLLLMGQGELRRQLAAACAADDMITVEYGVRPTVVEDLEEAVLVGDASGPAYRAEALVAADGVDSPVRPLLGGGEPLTPPQFVHYGSWPDDVAPLHNGHEVRMWSSPLLHVARLPTGRTGTPGPGEGAGRGSSAAPVGLPGPGTGHESAATLMLVVRGQLSSAELRRAASEHLREVRDLVEVGRDLPATPLHHHRPIERWTRHRIAVLGDAAQPLAPHAGQSAAQTVLDAIALAAAFDRYDGRVVAAFEHYEQLRAPARTQAASRAWTVAGTFHADGLARRLRDVLWSERQPDSLADIVGED